MDKKIEKYETFITFTLIVIYLLSNSFCIQNFGSSSYQSAICNLMLAFIILIFIFKNRLLSYYKLTTIPTLKKFLYFIPLLILMTVNFWGGSQVNNSIKEIVFHILNMIGIGFLEEIIFRGFLFQMMAKDNIKSAIIVTSLTFGIGHIINLLNGAPLVETLLQVCYALAIGYLFAIILYKGNSLWPCIIAHIVTNATSIFAIKSTFTIYICPILLIIISLSYAVYINKNIKRGDEQNEW